MGSYLSTTYLSGDDVGDYDAGYATSALSAAPGDPGDGSDIVILPGGIAIPRKTLWLILGALAVAALILAFRKREKRLKRLERAAEAGEDGDA